MIVLTATVVHNLNNNGVESNSKMFCNRHKKKNENKKFIMIKIIIQYSIQLHQKPMWGKKPYAARHNNMNNVVINRKLDSNDLLLNHKTISYLSK